jgi:hypothetical protein
MAILKFKKLIEDLETGSSQVISSVAKTVDKATSAGYAGTAYKATSAGYAGTARVAHYGSSGTGGLAGT